MATAGSPGLGPARSGRSCPDLGLKRGGETGSWSQKLGGERAAEPGGDSLFALPLALPHCHSPWAVQNPEPAGAMLKVPLPLGACARSWKSVRMASCGMARRNPLENKVALVTASTDG